jgi:hypothetical protein
MINRIGEFKTEKSAVSIPSFEVKADFGKVDANKKSLAHLRYSMHRSPSSM